MCELAGVIFGKKRRRAEVERRRDREPHEPKRITHEPQ